MRTFLESLSELAAGWTEFVARALTDGTMAFVVVLALWLLMRRRISAHLGYLLFLIVLVKIVLPLEVAGPSWLAWLSPMQWFAAEPPPPEVVAIVTEAAPRAASAPVSVAVTTQDLLFLAWFAIASSLLLALVAQQFRAQRIVHRARAIRTGDLPVDLTRLTVAANVKRPVRFLFTDEIDTPAAGGFFRPYVLLPNGLADGLEPGGLRWILLHELAHIRRGDVFVALAQRIVQIGLFFHPVVWLTNRLLDEQREFACDEEALVACGARRRECGEGFLSVVEWSRSRGGRGAAGAVAMFDNKSAIRRRLMRILQQPTRSGRAQRVLGAVLALAVASFVLPTANAAESTEVDLAMHVQDPGRADTLKELKKRLQKLQREQRALLKKLEALDKKSAKKSKRRPSRVLKRVDGTGKGIVVELDDITGEPEEIVEVEVQSGVSPFRGVIGRGKGQGGRFRVDPERIKRRVMRTGDVEVYVRDGDGNPRTFRVEGDGSKRRVILVDPEVSEELEAIEEIEEIEEEPECEEETEVEEIIVEEGDGSDARVWVQRSRSGDGHGVKVFRRNGPTRVIELEDVRDRLLEIDGTDVRILRSNGAPVVIEKLRSGGLRPKIRRRSGDDAVEVEIEVDETRPEKKSKKKRKARKSKKDKRKAKKKSKKGKKAAQDPLFSGDVRVDVVQDRTELGGGWDLRRVVERAEGNGTLR